MLCALSTCPAGAATPGSATRIKFTDKDEHMYFWFPLLAGLSELTFDPRSEIRWAWVLVVAVQGFPLGASSVERLGQRCWLLAWMHPPSHPPLLAPCRQQVLLAGGAV